MCTLGHASFSCASPLFKSHWIVLFQNPRLPNLRVIWVRTPELTYFHMCSLKGGLKDNSETQVSQPSNKNYLSDQLAAMPEILT